MLRDAGATTSVFPTTHLREIDNTAMTVVRLAQYMRSRHIHVVHCNGQKSQIYGSPAATLARVPCIYWMHHIPPTALGTDLMGDVALLLPATLRLTVSTAANKAACRHPLVRCAPLVLWPGLDPEWLNDVAPRAVAVRADGYKRILCLGRIQAWKGQHVLVKAAAELMRSRSDVRMEIVGSPSLVQDEVYYQSLQHMVEALGLRDTVAFVPHAADVVSWYRRCAVVVHTSVEAEPFGLVLVEALACGRPVIATSAGGPLDITDHGRVGGLLVPPGDHLALARAIETLLDNPDMATRLGTEGQLRVRQLYSARRMVDDLQVVYEGAVR
jgi:glycosyltransferase involved in cell wall biosynthesis